MKLWLICEKSMVDQLGGFPLPVHTYNNKSLLGPCCSCKFGPCGVIIHFDLYSWVSFSILSSLEVLEKYSSWLKLTLFYLHLFPLSYFAGTFIFLLRQFLFKSVTGFFSGDGSGVLDLINLSSFVKL